MNYLEQEDTSMSSSEVIYAHSNWKKKSLFVLVSGSLLTKLFFYSLNIPRGLLRRNNEVKKVRSFPLKKKAMKRSKLIVYSFLTHVTKLDRYLNPSCIPKTVKACTKRKFALRSNMHKQLRLLVNP